jgi:hypothetical protein
MKNMMMMTAKKLRVMLIMITRMMVGTSTQKKTVMMTRRTTTVTFNSSQQSAVAPLPLPVAHGPVVPPVMQQQLPPIAPLIPLRQLRPVHEALLPVGRVPSFNTSMPQNIVDLVSTWCSMGMDKYRLVDKGGWLVKHKIAFGKFQYLYDMATHDSNNVFIGNNPAAVDVRAREMDQSRALQRNKTLSVAQYYTYCKDQDAKTKRRPNQRGHSRHDERRVQQRIGDQPELHHRFEVPPAATAAAAVPTAPTTHVGCASARQQNTLEYAFHTQAMRYAAYTGLDRGLKLWQGNGKEKSKAAKKLPLNIVQK